MNKIVTLKDSTTVHIRPLSNQDIERSTSFFNRLPAEDRQYFRMDVTKPGLVQKRIENMISQPIDRLIASFNEEIVAEGALEREERDWKSHVGEIRLIVSEPYRRKGLGMLMARELYFLAVSLKLDEIIVKIMKPQSSALSIFKRLGFRTQTTLPDYVTDSTGQRHDLIILRCPLSDFWKELEEHIEDSDWQRFR